MFVFWKFFFALSKLTLRAINIFRLWNMHHHHHYQRLTDLGHAEILTWWNDRSFARFFFIQLDKWTLDNARRFRWIYTRRYAGVIACSTIDEQVFFFFCHCTFVKNERLRLDLIDRIYIFLIRTAFCVKIIIRFFLFVKTDEIRDYVFPSLEKRNREREKRLSIT